jgi:hypothetical protein
VPSVMCRMTDDFYDDFFQRVTAWLTSAIHVIEALIGDNLDKSWLIKFVDEKRPNRAVEELQAVAPTRTERRLLVQVS